MKGSCNYAFNIILNQPDIELRDGLERSMQAAGVEFRRGSAGGGNQLRQPYLKNIIKIKNFKNFKNVERVHFFGYYIGNYPELKKEKILKITKLLNSLDI